MLDSVPLPPPSVLHYQADRFIAAWRAAGFRLVGHVVFRKAYASSTRLLSHHHEQAYLLAKGDARMPATALPDVLEWIYTGNRLHPTQKPVAPLKPLVEAFCRPGSLVLDLRLRIDARRRARARPGVPWDQLDYRHHRTASARLAGVAGNRL